MAEDILFSLGVENEAAYLAQINRVISATNAAFGAMKLPNLTSGLGAISAPPIDMSAFSVANANVGELEKAYEHLRTTFTQGGDTTLINEVSTRLRELNGELRNTNSPSGGNRPFSLATASVGELQRELSRLQRQFTQGSDTSSITAIRERIVSLKTEMGAVNATSFTERLRAAFSQSLADASDWQGRILEIAGGNIIANLFQKVGEGVINAGKFAINSAAQFESLRASLDVITGSEGLGGKLFNQFQTLAAKSPFNFSDVGEQGTKLLAMGIPIEDVTNRLSRIGDVAAGVGREKLPSIVYAYGQIKSQGKAMAGDLSQFINAGVPIIEVLAETLKKPTQEIKTLASAGKISFADIDKALLSMTDKGGKFFEMMKTQSNTFEGLWSSMEDGFQLLAANLGAQMLPLAKSIVIAITEATASVSNLLSGGTSNETESSIGKLLSAAGGLIKVIGSPIFTLFGKTLSFISDNMLALSGVALGLTIAVKAQAIAVALDAAATAAWNVVNGLSYTIGLSLIGVITAVEGAYLALTTATLEGTVAAVGFWLVSNPVGWIALGTAIAGAAAAYLIFSDSTKKATLEATVHQNSVSGVIDKYKDEKVTVDGLFSLLNTSPRKKQIEEMKSITTQYGGLLSNIKVEKDLLGETENSAKQKSEQQALAAKRLIADYGKILPSYITEKSLIGDTEQAEKNRAAARDIIHKNRLAQIAEQYIAEKKLEVQKELIDLNIKRNAERVLDDVASKQGFFATLQRGLSKEWNDISVEDFRQSENEKLAILEELNKNGQKIAEDAFNQLSKVDSAPLFNPESLKAAETAVQGFANGSLKDLNERLKGVRDELEKANPKSAVFGKLAIAAAALDDKIKSINDSLKLFGLNANSLAGLQARLSIVQESINKADPNSKGFNDLLTKSKDLNDRIKVIQDRIKEFSLVSGSAESFNFQLSKLNEELNKQPIGSGLIGGLREQIKATTKEYENLKIALGISPPLDSLAGLNNKLSELQKKMSELPKGSKEFRDLGIEIQATKAKIDSLTDFNNAINTEVFKRIVPTGTIDNIERLSKEISDIEAMSSIPMTLQVKLEMDKADLETIRKSLGVIDIGKIDKSNFKEILQQPQQISPFLQGTINTGSNAPISTQNTLQFVPQTVPQLPTTGDNFAAALSISLGTKIENTNNKFDIPKVEANISAYERLGSTLGNFAQQMGATEIAASDFASEMTATFEQMAVDIQKAIAVGLGNALFSLGEGLGNAMVGVGSFSEAMQGALFDLGKALLVELPKVLGMGLIQSAFTPTALLTFPANLALVAAGLALMGVSGLASGILGGLEKKKAAEKEKNKVPASFNQSVSGAAVSQAAGLSGQNAEKPFLTNNISITMPIYGLDGVIISQIQKQEVIRQELK